MNWPGFTKALVPGVVSLITMTINWLATGDFDMNEMKIVLAGALTSGLVFLFPNGTPPLPNEGTSYETPGTPTLR